MRRAGRVAALALPLSRDTPASSAAPNAFSSIQSLTLPCTNASSIVAGGEGSASAAATIGDARVTARGFGCEEPAEAFSSLFILAFLVERSSGFGGL